MSSVNTSCTRFKTNNHNKHFTAKRIWSMLGHQLYKNEHVKGAHKYDNQNKKDVHWSAICNQEVSAQRKCLNETCLCQCKPEGSILKESLLQIYSRTYEILLDANVSVYVAHIILEHCAKLTKFLLSGEHCLQLTCTHLKLSRIIPQKWLYRWKLLHENTASCVFSAEVSFGHAFNSISFVDKQ